MQFALNQAKTAAETNEVPVGAVLVLNGSIVAAAHNRTEHEGNPMAHAEINCLQQALCKISRFQLEQGTMYITLEPCPMCAGALLQSRVATVVYGARNTLLGERRSLRQSSLADFRHSRHTINSVA